MPAYRKLMLGLLAAALLSCGGQSDADVPRAAEEPGQVSEDPPRDELHLDFDRPLYRAGDRHFSAGEGWPDAVVIESQPEVLELVTDSTGQGQAVSFPPRCSGANCQRALVQLADDDRLDPGAQSFGFGARLRLPADQTDTGSNIVQKGRYETSGGQWKLQVDGIDGRPSCVVQGELDGERATVKVKADQSVADDSWHSVACQLDDSELTITVDQITRTVGAEVGEISNSEPVRIGASGPKASDDQFHGDIDDVHFCLGECGTEEEISNAQ